MRASSNQLAAESNDSAEPEPVQPNKRKRALILAAAGIVIVIVILVEVLPSALNPKTFTLRGAMAVICSSTYGSYSSATCAGYGDLSVGAQVEVLNEKQEILTTGTLLQGADPTATTGRNYSASVATIYTFSIPDVPRGEKQYGVHIGNANRGVIWEDEEKASNDGFFLSIGGN